MTTAGSILFTCTKCSEKTSMITAGLCSMCFRQVYPDVRPAPTAAAPSPDAALLLALLHERDRYRDALRAIVDEIGAAPTEEEALDVVGEIAKRALESRPVECEE